MIRLDAVPEVKEEEGRDDIVEVGLDDEPTEDIVDPFAGIGVGILREGVGCGGRCRGRREEVGADVVAHLAAEGDDQAGGEEGDWDVSLSHGGLQKAMSSLR